ncbi:MAG: lysylphosphatidylglycerol synthase transmembrane domain-containing protein [Thermoleophilia bacterium]
MTPSRQATIRRIGRLFQSRLLRAAISALLLVLLVSRLNLSDLATTLSQVVPSLLVVGILLFVAASLISVFKWQLILKSQGIQAPFFYLVSLFYIGFFFSNFLPTNFGGDVVKIFKLGQTTGQPVEAASSVFMDRASSTFALLLIAIVPAIIELRMLGTGVSVAILSVFIIGTLMILLGSNARFVSRLSKLPLLRSDPMGLRRHARNFYFSLHDFRHKKGTLAAMMAISLVYQIVQIFSIYFLALSLGIQLSVLYYFIFIPVIMTVSMIPISLNGLGVREVSWVFLFEQAGVSRTEAFSMSILMLLVMTATSLFGGVFYLFDRILAEPQTKPDHGQS